MNKFSMWTVTYITKSGIHSFLECDTEDSLKEELKLLQDDGQDMEYVNVFPPSSNTPLSELI